MLDIQLFRNEPERVAKGLAAKNADRTVVEEVRELDAKRRDLTYRTEQLKKERNDASRKIGEMLKSGKDAEAEKTRVRDIGEVMKEIDQELADLNGRLHNLLLMVPNLPHESAPVGLSEEANVFVRDWGGKPSFAFSPKPHWDLGKTLDILDLERAAKLSGSGFYVLKGRGATLQRALINFMTDMHVEKHGYTEIRPPYIVTRETMTGTGQLPKFETELYRIQGEDMYLIPTAEVPITNLHAGEILTALELPKTYVSYTPCFRVEAGAAGKETRGMTRVHQFDKVEMVRLVLPEDSYKEIEILLGHAEEVLQSLGLYYRVMELCSCEMSFSASKCYDLEVLAPGMDRYLEVSSCSNFEDYQARRASIRFRREKGAKPEFVHTLNASGLALPRLMIAMMETYQQADGTIRIPEILQPYTRFEKID